MNLNFTGRKKKMCEKKYSIIEINLFRPTKKSYPEFDYEKICKDYLKEDDSSGEDERFHDRAAEELVKRLNAKYGTKRDKKGRRLRFGDADDFMDKTVGYDLSDPFIDDTEAYDEQVPSTMDTAKGGFYVNRGRLDFRLKYMDDSDNDDEGPPKRKTSEKKRAITDDDDEDENKSNRDDNNEDIEADMLKASTSKGTDTVETGISVMGMGYDEQLKRENTDPTLRLSSNGAPPMNKRSIKQTLIKRRRLIGQPPTMKLTPSPTVKAALGVKRKLKNPMKKVAGNMNEEELDNFLKDMVGGHEIPFDETMRQAIKDLKNESALTPKPSVSISTGGSIADEHESCATTSSSTSNEDNISSPVKRSRLQSVTPEINTGITGTLPTAGSNVKELEQISVLSPKLTEMIETYKKRTSEFGAPNKKIRLPPSLVDLCIGIEHQCNSDGLTHAQKTRVFDSLANWVLVQRNSLYIRMKMQKEKKEASSTIEGSFGLPSNNTDVPVSSVGITSSVVVEGSKKVLDNISGSPVASVQKSTIASSETHITMASPKSSSQNSTIFKNPNQTLPNTKIEAVHPSKVTSKETMIEKAGSSSAMKTTVNGLPKTSNNTSSSHPSRQSASSSSTKKMNAVTNASQLSLPQAQLLSAFAASNNPQMLALMSAVLQQQAVAQSDAQQQRQLAAALATLKMQSVLAANACQSPELLRQYQVLMNTLNKSSLTSTSSTVASSSSSRSKHMNNNNSSNTNIQSKQCPSTLQLPLLKQQNSNSSHSGILDSKSTATTGVQSHHQKQSTSNIQSTLQTKEINSNLLKNLQKMNRLDNTFRNPKAVSSFKSSTSVMKNVVAKASSTEREKKSSSTAASAPSLLSSSSSSSSGSQPFKQHSKTSNINLGQASQFSKSTIPFNKLSKSSAEFSSKSIKASHVTSVGSSRQSKDSSQRNQSSKVPSKSSAANIASHLEKTKALELINTAAEALQIAIQEAVPADEDFEPLRKRPALEGVSLNERKFNWTEKLRVSLKTMVNTFFDSLNGHLTQNDLASKLAQYLHSCVFPLFKGAIAFTDFYNELASLVPERLYLLSLPEMKEYCKKSKKISETNAAGSTGLHNVSITKGTTLQESSVVKSHRLSSSSGPSPSVSNLKTKPTLAESIAQAVRKDDKLSTKSEGKQQSTATVAAIGSVSADTSNNLALLSSNAEQHSPVALNLSKTMETQHRKTFNTIDGNNNSNSNKNSDKGHPATSQGVKNSEKHAGSSITSTTEKQPSVFNPKLTPGQKVILAREAEERERLAARERAEFEKREKEKELERILREAERLEEAAKEEEAERQTVAEEERKRNKIEALEAERLANEEAKRQELAEIEQKLREETELARKEEVRLRELEAERLKSEEAERVRLEELKKDEAERLRKEEVARIKREEAERIRKEETDRILKEEAERIRKEEAETVRREMENRKRQEAERRRKQEEEERIRIEAERREEIRQMEEKRKQEERRKQEEDEAAANSLNELFTKNEDEERLSQQEEDDLLDRISPFDFGIEQLELPQGQEDSSTLVSGTQNQEDFQNISNPPASGGVIYSKVTSPQTQRAFDSPFNMPQRNSPMFQQLPPSSTSPYSLHSVPASPLAHSVVSPAQHPVSSPMQHSVMSPAQQNAVASPLQHSVASPMQRPMTSPLQPPVPSPMQRPVLSPMQRPVASPMQCPVASPMQCPVASPIQQVPQSPSSSRMVYNSSNGTSGFQNYASCQQFTSSAYTPQQMNRNEVGSINKQTVSFSPTYQQGVFQPTLNRNSQSSQSSANTSSVGPNFQQNINQGLYPSSFSRHQDLSPPQKLFHMDESSQSSFAARQKSSSAIHFSSQSSGISYMNSMQQDFGNLDSVLNNQGMVQNNASFNQTRNNADGSSAQVQRQQKMGQELLNYNLFDGNNYASAQQQRQQRQQQQQQLFQQQQQVQRQQLEQRHRLQQQQGTRVDFEITDSGQDLGLNIQQNIVFGSLTGSSSQYRQTSNQQQATMYDQRLQQPFQSRYSNISQQQQQQQQERYSNTHRWQ